MRGTWWIIGSFFRLCLATESYLRGIPTVPFNTSISGEEYSLQRLNALIVDTRYATAVDNNGLTLIPPTLLSFAETFGSDLASIGIHVPVRLGFQAEEEAIFLTISDNHGEFLDAAGRPTSEGYSLKVTKSSIIIAGASPLGTWWGTRTILQQAALGELKMAVGDGLDSAGWGERGMMLDVGRHYYPPGFIIEMCAYMSYFKQNVFHLHLSDHVWNPANLYSHELALELYASFRPGSDDPAIAGLPRPSNETYSPSDLDNIQRRCAARGVTIIPELESPGHSMATTDWKPELALADFSMLNISYPETIPTVKSYWKALLPGFHSKVVHIGADEYASNLVDEYTYFVNTMSSYIREISGKTIRIWGTFPPSYNSTNVETSVSIQQWEMNQDNALFDFIDRGYHVLNSDDYFYLDLKYSDSYPASIDLQRVFSGAPGGGPYSPNIFDHSNATNNPPRNNPYVLGQLAVVWNDWGPNASTYNEAYWMVRDGLPALGDKQWGGQLTLSEYRSIFPIIQASVPAQNLDRRITSKSSSIFSYAFHESGFFPSRTVRDASGNGYDGQLVGKFDIKDNAVQLDGKGYLQTPLDSKGRNYTLKFSVMSSALNYGGVLFSGTDSSLTNGNGTSPYLMFVSGNIAYPVDLTLPLEQWVDVTVEGLGSQTFISVTSKGGGKKTREVTTNMGIWGGGMQEGPMAIEAPINRIGEGFKGRFKDISLSGTT